MKEIKLVRIDDRLLHTQIILFWLKKFNINTIYIINNQLVKNKYLCQIYQLSTPPHISLKIFSIEQAIAYVNNQKNHRSSLRIMVLIKNLTNLVTLHKAGFLIDTVQIGGGILENVKSKRQVTNYILTKYHDEISYLISSNINIYCQNATDSEKIYIHTNHK